MPFRWLLAAGRGGGGFMVDGPLVGESGKTYKVVAGVIQNDGTGTWRLVTGSHADINVSTVVADTSKIRVTYSFTATNVVTFHATADDAFAVGEYMTGASVGLTFADVVIAKNGVQQDPTATNVASAVIWLFGIFEI
jgi:hypothetical protein